MSKATANKPAKPATDLPKETTDEKAKRRATSVAGMTVSTVQDSYDQLLWNHLVAIRNIGMLAAGASGNQDLKATEIAKANLRHFASSLGADVRVKGRSIVLEFSGPSIYRRVLKVIRANSAALDKACTAGSFGDMKLLSVPHAGVTLDADTVN